MKRIALLIAMTASAANAQSQTNCFAAGNSVQCQTYGGSATQPAPPSIDSQPLINQLLSPQGVNGYQQGAARNQQSLDAQEGAKNRRAAAYAQVGNLIAQGKCAEARNLAKFYGHPDIISDTAKACPL